MLSFKCVVIATVLFSVHVFADGVFMVVKGDVKVTVKGKPAVAAKVGMKVNQTDKVVSGKDARAKIVMSDKNILNISPDTQLVIEAYKFNEAKDEKNVSLNVLYGKVRATVNQKYDGEKNKFQVKTPSAVAGVRGTDFLTSYNPTTNASKVVTFEGAVAVGSGTDASGKIQNPVTVPAGSFSVASDNGPPSAAAPVPPQELQAMNKDSNADGNGARPDAAPRAPAAEGGEKSKDKEGAKEGGKEGGKSEGKSEPKTEAKADGKPSGEKTGGEAKPGGPEGKPNASGGPNGGGREPGAVGPTGPAAGSAPPAPSMISIGTEINTSVPTMPTLPDLPPVMGDIYQPPQVPPDLIQQNTNLTINVNVQ